MRTPRRSIALAGLLLTASFGLGLDVNHADGHGHAPDADEALRFEAGHEQPISDQHLEAAHILGEDSCLACALRAPSTALELRAISKARMPRLSGSTSGEVARRPLQPAFALRFGRAPPTA